MYKWQTSLPQRRQTAKSWHLWTVVLEKAPESPLDNKEIKPANLKGREINPEYSLEGLMLKLKLQYFGNLMRTDDSLENPWCWERFWASEDETADQHHGCNEHELRQTQGDGEGQGGLEFWGCKKSDTTGRLNNNITTIYICVRLLVGRKILCDKKGIFLNLCRGP